jgi:hypothetical protein
LPNELADGLLALSQRAADLAPAIACLEGSAVVDCAAVDAFMRDVREEAAQYAMDLHVMQQGRGVS